MNRPTFDDPAPHVQLRSRPTLRILPKPRHFAIYLLTLLTGIAGMAISGWLIVGAVVGLLLSALVIWLPE